MTRAVIILLAATFIFSFAYANENLLPTKKDAVISQSATAEEMLLSCREMIPKDVKISGRIILRNRRGIIQKEYAYELTRKNGETSLKVDGEEFALPSDFSTPLLGTDVTASDLTLNYLNWRDIAFDDERDGETVHGQTCTILILKQDARCVRVWVDRKTGAMMQAEEWSENKCIRRLWGTRIKKFGDRWVPNVLEVETQGSGHRTKITVEELQ